MFHLENNNYVPPVPVATVQLLPTLAPLQKQENLKSFSVPMLVDTGADKSVISLRELRRIELNLDMSLPTLNFFDVEIFFEKLKRAKAVEFVVHWEKARCEQIVQFLVLDIDECILGRDALDKHTECEHTMIAINPKCDDEMVTNNPKLTQKEF